MLFGSIIVLTTTILTQGGGGAHFFGVIKKREVKPRDKWQLDEMMLRIHGERLILEVMNLIFSYKNVIKNALQLASYLVYWVPILTHVL